ncbi:GNAT superfamily N-acetyltransferase [Arthrobacter sp. W4I7]|nr:GNAT superfamily N-acetyltransferase [Arthrobacter sp. W4I7]
MTAEPDLRREPLETAGQRLNAGLQPLDAVRGPLANRPRPLDPDVLTVLNLPMQDPRVRPLLDELAVEYDTRYGDLFGREGAAEELNRYPAEEFAGPGGALLVIQENGESIAGGAFRRYDDATAELKRIWTHSAHRRRGLARLVLAELEALAVRRGYTRLYLTTGPRQPEAKHLYLTTGYEPQFDLDADPETIKFLAFTKDLSGHLQN